MLETNCEKVWLKFYLNDDAGIFTAGFFNHTDFSKICPEIFAESRGCIKNAAKLREDYKTKIYP